MLVQFHIQKTDDLSQSEFIAQSDFDENGVNPVGQTYVEWAQELGRENIQRIKDSKGAEQMMVCTEDYPEFYVMCGVGESGLPQMCKRRQLNPK